MAIVAIIVCSSCNSGRPKTTEEDSSTVSNSKTQKIITDFSQFDETYDCKVEGVSLILVLSKDKDDVSWCGVVRDGKMIVEQKYNGILIFPSNRDYAEVFVNKPDGKTLSGICNLVNGKETIPCIYDSLKYIYDEFVVEAYKSGNTILFEMEGKVAPKESGVQPYKKGDYWGIKTNGESRFDPSDDGKKFVRLERVPGKPNFFAFQDADGLCGIVHYTGMVTVPRFDKTDFEFLSTGGSNATFAKDAVLFTFKDGSKDALNCNNQPAGKKLTNEMLDEWAKERLKKLYGK